MIKKFLIALFVILILLAGVALWAYQQIQALHNSKLNSVPTQLITIEKGTTSKKLAQQLVQQKLLDNAQWLPILLKLHPEYKIKAGTYSLNNVQTLAQLLQLLHSGKEVQLTFRGTEGTTFVQWRKTLQNTPHLQQTLADKSEQQIYQMLGLPAVAEQQWQKIEGWLYPDTYHYTVGSTDLELLKRASDRMQKTLAAAWQQRADNLPLKTPYELLILASIVEKETAIASERAEVAAVFINRLKRGMKLQTDPTVIYGLGEQFDGNIRRKDLQQETAYNTYVIDGLPPTPIAMPSEASLLAVAKPAVNDYLYFVADGTGGHKFSRTLAEHNRAVQQYLKWYRTQKKQSSGK